VISARSDADVTEETVGEQISKEISSKTKASRPFPGRMLIEKSRSSIDSDSNWLITLSDVLSLLLVFFVMFSVAKNNRTAKTVTDKTRNRQTIDAGMQMPVSPVGEKIRDEMNSNIKKLDLENDVSVRAVDKEIIITMKEKVTFRPGEAEILESSGPMLANIARVVQRHPSFLVDIEGHTDNVPIRTRLYPSNWELSVARATSVLKLFINNYGIDPSRLSLKGNADQMPAVPNDTSENRGRNRRVEIRLKEKEPQTLTAVRNSK
jgi:chemotaxis protein MotB